MYNSKDKTITFPHLIPLNRLGNREYTFNDVDGGVKRLADFNIERNSFFGGQVTILGLIRELGIWACQHYETRKVIGFYVDDPNRLTEKGRQLVRERFSDCTVIFEPVVEVPSGITPQERARREELRLELVKHGIAPEMITHTNADGLHAMLEAVRSGKAEMKMAVEEKTAIGTLGETVDQPVQKPKRGKSMEV